MSKCMTSRKGKYNHGKYPIPESLPLWTGEGTTCLVCTVRHNRGIGYFLKDIFTLKKISYPPLKEWAKLILSVPEAKINEQMFYVPEGVE